MFLLAGVAYLALGSLLAAVIVRCAGARVIRWEPRARHRALVVLAALPAVTAVGLLFAASLPSLMALAVPALDHCSAHDDGHAHLCFAHFPKSGIHTGLLLSLVFLVCYAALRVAFAAFSLVRAARVVAALAKTGEQRADLGITLIDTTQTVCLAAGLFRPRVFVSRGLFDILSAEEREVILAHERAHVRRRDAAIASLVRALAMVHMPRVGSWLVAEIEVAAEQICDEEAAAAVGDRVAVAAAILTVERAAQHTVGPQFDPVAVAFGVRAVERRVEALLAAPLPQKSFGALAVLFGAALLGAFVLADEVHHLTESLLSVIAH